MSVNDYRIGDDCVWPHCSNIAKCPACKKDERIAELEAEVERLRKEFYLYEIEGTYKGNSIRHWYNKAQAYGTKMSEFKAENERLRAVYEAAIAVNNTCQIESCKSPVGDEPLKLEQAIAAAQEDSDECE